MLKLNLTKIKALIIKEIIVLLKDPKSRFALMMPPIIQLILFSSVATLDVFNIKLGVINYDNGSYSREIVQDIAASKEYFTKISYFDNYSEIKENIDKQKIIGAIVFNSDFSRKIAAGKTAEIQILFDGRRLNSASIVSGYLQKIINESIAKKISHKISFQSQNISQNKINAEVNIRNYFNPNLNYKWFIIPSLMALIFSTSILAAASLSIARERELGTFDQLIVSPLNPFEIILGKIFAIMMIGIVQAIIIFSMVAAIVPFSGNLFFMFCGIILYMISLVCIGLFISSISGNQQQATLISFFFLMPITLTSGFASPFYNMPLWMRNISDFINPIHHFVTITQMIFTKNANFDLLKYNFLMLFVMSLITLIFSVWFFKRRML
jgi:ABC-2 type transport system permease protein